MEATETKLFENPEHFLMDVAEVVQNVRLITWAAQQIWEGKMDDSPNTLKSLQFAILSVELIDG